MEIAKQKIEIVKTRLAAYQEKNKLEPPLSDMLANMRRQAEALGFCKPDSNK